MAKGRPRRSSRERSGSAINAEEIEGFLEENPSSMSLLRDAEFIGKAYERARTKAAIETEFPETPPNPD
jgi:hypothetical protein